MSNRTKATIRATLASSRGSFTNNEIVGSLLFIYALLAVLIFGLVTASREAGEVIFWSGTYTVPIVVASVLMAGVGVGTFWLHRHELAKERAEAAAREE